jgi:hypothetical protein
MFEVGGRNLLPQTSNFYQFPSFFLDIAWPFTPPDPSQLGRGQKNEIRLRSPATSLFDVRHSSFNTTLNDPSQIYPFLG